MRFSIQDILKADVLNPLMSLSPAAWTVIRTTTQKLLLIDSELDKNEELKKR